MGLGFNILNTSGSNWSCAFQGQVASDDLLFVSTCTRRIFRVERNQVAKFEVLEFNQVYDIVRIHTVGIDIYTTEVSFDSLTSAKSRITTGTDYPLT